MRDHTFREMVSDDLTSVMEEYIGTAWGEDEWALHNGILDWIVRRFDPAAQPDAGEHP